MSLRDAWEAEARNWVRFARTPEHDSSFWKFGLPHLLDILPPPGRLTVDLGCGEGRLPRLLRRRGHRVVGVDASFTMIQHAAGDDCRKYVVADAACLPLRSGSADLVIAYMSLQDMDDVAGAVAEAGRVLVAGGTLCFAILHPLNTAGAFTEPTASAPFVIDGSYLESRRYAYYTDRDGIQLTFHGAHRPLEAYFDALATAGLLVERLLEPPIGSDFIEADDAERRWQRVPLYLLARGRKPGQD
jgi:SAM-dependent methyltransferase